MRKQFIVVAFVLLNVVLALFSNHAVVRPAESQNDRPIVVISIDGPISPATDEYLRTSLDHARAVNARLFVITLNTPGGLLNSTQTMVQNLLESKIPTVVYVSPSGGGATSAGVFITLAGHFAVMAPATTIGAAHPVSGDGQDVSGDMREKVENFAVSLIKAIAEQRGRNVKWAEQAVRESVSITANDALSQKVIDFIASDLAKVFAELEGRTVNTLSGAVTLTGLSAAPVEHLPMTFMQQVRNFLCDPNIAIVLGLLAMLGIGMEFYHPGMVFPGLVGVICLVLSFIAAQVLPFNLGGLALIGLAALFFIVESFMPTFGVWGGAGVVSLVLGAVYLVDTDMIWGADQLQVNRPFIATLATVFGLFLAGIVYLAASAQRRRVVTGREGLVGKMAQVKSEFKKSGADALQSGRVQVMGEYWNAKLSIHSGSVHVGDWVQVAQVDGMTLTVERPGGERGGNQGAENKPFELEKDWRK